MWYEAEGREKSEVFTVPHLAMAHELVSGVESLSDGTGPKAKIAFPEYPYRQLVSMAEAALGLPAAANDGLSQILVPVLICCGELDVRGSGDGEAASHILNAWKWPRQEA